MKNIPKKYIYIRNIYPIYTSEIITGKKKKYTVQNQELKKIDNKHIVTKNMALFRAHRTGEIFFSCYPATNKKIFFYFSLQYMKSCDICNYRNIRSYISCFEVPNKIKKKEIYDDIYLYIFSNAEILFRQPVRRYARNKSFITFWPD